MAIMSAPAALGQSHKRIDAIGNECGLTDESDPSSSHCMDGVPNPDQSCLMPLLARVIVISLMEDNHDRPHIAGRQQLSHVKSVLLCRTQHLGIPKQHGVRQ